MTPLKSIFLFADSQLLFRREDGQLLLDRVVKAATRERLKAAYVGASNGDHPDFYALFVAAMEGASIFDCKMISSALTEAELAFLNEADLILLAGGDVELGWRTFLANGLNNHLIRRSQIETLKLVPFIIGAHEESNNWETTTEFLRLSATDTRAIGLPTGGGAIYHPDQTLEPVRHPLVELSLSGGNVHETFLYPERGQRQSSMR
jgi:hypothetical protein